MGQMLQIDEQAGRAETASRQRYLRPGVSLRIADLTDVLGGYATRVVEIDHGLIWIELPMRRDGMLSLERGELVSVRFERQGDAVYSFDSVVAEVRDDDRAPFALAMPVTINRRRQRADPRLALVLDARFDVRGAVDQEAKVVDLSAGGLGLICEQHLDEGDDAVVRCQLPGPDGDLDIELTACVQSTSLYGRTPSGRTLYQYGMKFIDADEELREQILMSVIWNLTRNPRVV